MENGRYKKLYDLNAWSFKVLRILPGFITLVILTSPVWASLLGIPQLVLYYITFLAVYWVFKSFLSTVANFIGLSRMNRTLKIDWNEKIKEASWQQSLADDYLPEKYEDLYHVVIIPFYREDYDDVLFKTTDALAKSDYDCKNKVFVVFAVEESGGDQAKENAERLVRDFSDKFKGIRYYIHPKDIPGEIKGIAGANLRFAAHEFVEEIKKEGYKVENFLVTKFDSDLRVHPKFLSALTYKYIVTPDRYHCFFSPAIMLYSNNFWDVPILMRVVAASITLGVMSEWILSKSSKESFSCYSFNLDLLDRIDYWDPQIGVDDTSFYWNAYLHLDGRFRGEEFYIPTYSDAVESNAFVETHVAQYKQLHRWGWGVIVFPMTLQGFIRNRKIPFIEKIGSFLGMIYARNFILTTAFLITFGIPIISFMNRDIGSLGIAHILPQVISFLLTISLVFLFPSRFIMTRLYGVPPKEKGILFFYWHYVEMLFLIVAMFIFHLFPYIQAQMEMMVGRVKKQHMITPKKSEIT